MDWDDFVMNILEKLKVAEEDFKLKYYPRLTWFKDAYGEHLEKHFAQIHEQLKEFRKVQTGESSAQEKIGDLIDNSKKVNLPEPEKSVNQKPMEKKITSFNQPSFSLKMEKKPNVKDLYPDDNPLSFYKVFVSFFNHVVDNIYAFFNYFISGLNHFCDQHFFFDFFNWLFIFFLQNIELVFFSNFFFFLFSIFYIIFTKFIFFFFSYYSYFFSYYISVNVYFWLFFHLCCFFFIIFIQLLIKIVQNKSFNNLLSFFRNFLLFFFFFCSMCLNLYFFFLLDANEQINFFLQIQKNVALFSFLKILDFVFFFFNLFSWLFLVNLIFLNKYQKLEKKGTLKLKYNTLFFFKKYKLLLNLGVLNRLIVFKTLYNFLIQKFKQYLFIYITKFGIFYNLRFRLNLYFLKNPIKFEIFSTPIVFNYELPKYITIKKFKEQVFNLQLQPFIINFYTNYEVIFFGKIKNFNLNIPALPTDIIIPIPFQEYLKISINIKTITFFTIFPFYNFFFFRIISIFDIFIISIISYIFIKMQQISQFLYQFFLYFIFIFYKNPVTFEQRDLLYHETIMKVYPKVFTDFLTNQKQLELYELCVEFSKQYLIPKNITLLWETIEKEETNFKIPTAFLTKIQTEVESEIEGEDSEKVDSLYLTDFFKKKLETDLDFRFKYTELVLKKIPSLKDLCEILNVSCEAFTAEAVFTWDPDLVYDPRVFVNFIKNPDLHYQHFLDILSKDDPLAAGIYDTQFFILRNIFENLSIIFSQVNLTLFFLDKFFVYSLQNKPRFLDITLLEYNGSEDVQDLLSEYYLELDRLEYREKLEYYLSLDCSNFEDLRRDDFIFGEDYIEYGVGNDLIYEYNWSFFNFILFLFIKFKLTLIAIPNLALIMLLVSYKFIIFVISDFFFSILIYFFGFFIFFLFIYLLILIYKNCVEYLYIYFNSVFRLFKQKSLKFQNSRDFFKFFTKKNLKQRSNLK